MNSFTFNKIAGAFLGTLLLVFVIVEVSHQIYPNPRASGHVENPGYVVAGMEHGGGHTETAEVEEVVDLGAMLANASVEAGAGRFRACVSCHSTDEGGANGTGPNLWNIVNRPVASVEGYNYSNAMEGFGGNWTFERLFEFLQSPARTVPGTRMTYRGMRRDGQRAELLAYMRTLSNDPAALPAVNAQETMDHAAPAPASHTAIAPSTPIVEEAADSAMEEEVKMVEAADDATAEAMEGAPKDDAMMDDAPMEEEGGGDH